MKPNVRLLRKSPQYTDEFKKQIVTDFESGNYSVLPPFYADMPKTLEKIVASELKYLDAYEKAPFKTDLKYFWLTLRNIVFKGERSK